MFCDRVGVVTEPDQFRLHIPSIDAKQYLSFCCIQETYINIKDRYYFRVKGGKKIFQANRPKKKAGVDTLISKKKNRLPTKINQKR